MLRSYTRQSILVSAVPSIALLSSEYTCTPKDNKKGLGKFGPLPYRAGILEKCMTVDYSAKPKGIV